MMQVAAPTSLAFVPADPKVMICDAAGKILITISRTGIVLDSDVPLDDLARIFVERVNELMQGEACK